MASRLNPLPFLPVPRVTWRLFAHACCWPWFLPTLSSVPSTCSHLTHATSRATPLAALAPPRGSRPSLHRGFRMNDSRRRCSSASGIASSSMRSSWQPRRRARARWVRPLRGASYRWPACVAGASAARLSPASAAFASCSHSSGTSRLATITGGPGSWSPACCSPMRRPIALANRAPPQRIASRAVLELAFHCSAPCSSPLRGACPMLSPRRRQPAASCPQL